MIGFLLTVLSGFKIANVFTSKDLGDVRTTAGWSGRAELLCDGLGIKVCGINYS